MGGLIFGKNKKYVAPEGCRHCIYNLERPNHDILGNPYCKLGHRAEIDYKMSDGVEDFYCKEQVIYGSEKALLIESQNIANEKAAVETETKVAELSVSEEDKTAEPTKKVAKKPTQRKKVTKKKTDNE